MSMADNDWYSVLTQPSRAASTAMLALGIWVILLTLVNIIQGAYSPGFKVLWLGFLSNGALGEIYVAHDGISFAIDDIVFGVLGAALIVSGIWSMGSAFENGISGWFKDLPNTFSGLVSTEAGLQKTIADWLIVLGLVFYLGWSVQNNTWVDPGVFAVSITPFAFGVGLNLLNSAESES